MEKRSKVVKATANGTWNSNYGLMYRFEIEFENGDIGEYLSKKEQQTMFVIGQDMMYTLDGKEFNGKIFYKVKPIPQVTNAPTSFAPKAKDPETGKHIMRMSVLKVAGDLVINGDIKLHQILSYAQIFENFVNNGVDTLQNARPMPDNDDLPF